MEKESVVASRTGDDELVEITDPWGGTLASVPITYLRTGETEQTVIIVWDIRYNPELQEHHRIRYRDALWRKILVKFRERKCQAIFRFNMSGLEISRVYPPRAVSS
ncbi:MAG: hypothetical protein HY455_02200 [Parcubacteria group bacterium]|nr:hypothetical protein [Parcubacteria group bacterium]